VAEVEERKEREAERGETRKKRDKAKRVFEGFGEATHHPYPHVQYIPPAKPAAAEDST